MFIDIHAHAYRYAMGVFMRFQTAEELIAAYDKLDIEKGAILPIGKSGDLPSPIK